MNRSFVGMLCATALATTGAAFATPVLPEPFPATRYQAMRERSPFALATPVAPPPAQDKNFAEGWFWSGLSRVDGKDFVRVQARDLSVQFTLWGNEMDPETRVKLQSVEWSPNIGKSVVTITKDGQFAKLMFNDANLTAAASQPPPQPPANARPGGQPRLGVPNAPAAPAPGAPRTNNTTLLQPQRAGATRPIAPQPAASSVVTVPGAAGPKPATTGATTVPTEGGGRRRIRSIPLTPTQ